MRYTDRRKKEEFGTRENIRERERIGERERDRRRRKFHKSDGRKNVKF